MAKALGESRSGQKWIFAFAQIVVVEVDGDGEHVNRQRIGKGGVVVGGAGAFVNHLLPVARVLGTTASLPRVLACFSTYLCLSL